MINHKSIAPIIRSSIRVISDRLRQGGYHLQLRDLWDYLRGKTCKAGLIRIYTHLSQLVFGYIQHGRGIARKDLPKRTDEHLSIRIDAAHRTKTALFDAPVSPSKFGQGALELAEERYALMNSAQLTERRLIIETQQREVEEQLRDLSEKYQQLLLQQTQLAAEQAQLAALEKRPTEAKLHPSNNLYG